MAYLKVGTENASDISLYYEDHGTGQPVILVHGWPLNGASWEKQTVALLAAGYRVITYDRRGFGKSSQPATGYEYDTLAADLHALIEHLDLQNVALFGFSMGGGEVARYLGTYGSARVKKAGFLGSVAPALGQSETNPAGVPKSVFEGVKAAIRKDRYALLNAFMHNFYNFDALKDSRVSEEAVQASVAVGNGASYIGLHDCVDAWQTDLREDIKKITIPVLVLHGDSDRTVPVEVSGGRIAEFAPQAQLHVLKEAPHGFTLTHAEETNQILLDFLK